MDSSCKVLSEIQTKRTGYHHHPDQILKRDDRCHTRDHRNRHLDSDESACRDGYPISRVLIQHDQRRRTCDRWIVDVSSTVRTHRLGEALSNLLTTTCPSRRSRVYLQSTISRLNRRILAEVMRNSTASANFCEAGLIDGFEFHDS